MTEPFIVEVWGKPVGVVVKKGNAFRFHALAQPYFALDGAQFTTPGHARLAAARLEVDQEREAQSLPTGRSLGSASHWASSPPCGS
jgi:hypothetical protein